MKSVLRGLIFVHCLTAVLFAQTLAPNAPGADAHWESAGKQGIGTANSLRSKIWFTLQGGALNEVFYPMADQANIQNLQFVVFNPKTKKIETERDDVTHQIQLLNNGSLSFRQINTSKSGAWKITKDYVADSQNDSILVTVSFSGSAVNELYIFYDPSLNNSGMNDTAWTEGKAFLAAEADKASALICSKCEFGEMVNGFSGANDGFSQLQKNGRIVNQFARAEKGNVVQFARMKSLSGKSLNVKSNVYEIVLSFGKTSEEALNAARNSATKGFQQTRLEYEKGWRDYVETLPQVGAKYQAQLNVAALILKAHEDKTFRGGQIASLSKPWIYGAAANEPYVGGYHLVWARDLYQVSTAYMALGDVEAAKRALDYLFKIQQRADGSFPQISWLDGGTLGDAVQMDEVSYPLILTYQLGRNDRETYTKYVKRSADYIVKNGPRTGQERWEEKPGYSPATIAAEIAGLVCAAEIARKNGDEISAGIYLKTADDWQANVEKWTATTNGKYGDGNYYVRLTAKGKPDAGEKIVLSNGAGTFLENEIVDAGFLELVRLGVKSPDDSLIEKSIKVIDAQLKVDTPNGAGFYRYNHDGYGEMDDGRIWNWDGKYTGKGRIWALLSGERGQYELAKYNSDMQKMDGQSVEIVHAKSRLDAMANFANDGLMIPEQVWDKAETPVNIGMKFGEGTGSATPLAWSMAQFVRLAVNLRAGRNLDTPDIVYNRYVLGRNIEPAKYTAETKPADGISFVRFYYGKTKKIRNWTNCGNSLTGTLKMKEIVIAVDLGGTNLRTAAIDASGAILFRTRRETPASRDCGEIVRAIVESADECRKNISNRKIKAVSVAVPGTVSVDRGLIFKSPNLPCLNEFKLSAALESEFGIKAILENDANAAAIGENWLGASKAYADSIMVTLGTGIGGGVITGGKILRGKDGTAGEIGHICVEPFGAACGCGSHGCVEQYASATAIVRLAKDLATEYPSSNLKENPRPTAHDVYLAGAEGDALALEVFRRAGFYLGVALSGLINVLNPEIIVIGGGGSAGQKLFLPNLQATINQMAYREPAVRAKILLSYLGDDAGIIGAARVGFN